MGSVQSLITCPRCKSEECNDEFYYKTGEFNIFCPECGYSHTLYFDRDDEGKMIKKDDEGDYEMSNLKTTEKIIDNPIGAYEILYRDLRAQLGCLEDEESYTSFRSAIADMLDEDKEMIVYVEVSKLVDGEIVKEIIYGHKE